MTSFIPIVAKPIIVGKPAIVVVDIQKNGFVSDPANERLPFMSDTAERFLRAKTVIDAARANNVPIIFIQEAHRDDMIDFGRELDGSESIHCLESDPGTAFAVEELEMRPDD